ncbi:MAG: DUF3159 domain-containing protein [Chloroflexota bacterium]
MTAKLRELADEFRTVFGGRSSPLDSVAPPVVFLALNTLAGFEVAMGGSLLVALLIAGLRLRRRQSLAYALGGVGGVLLAILIAQWIGRAEGFFLPGIVSGGSTVLLAVGSVVLRRPLVAWTSHFTRRWPLAWYWHPQVRPAYDEVTLAWAAFFALRLLLQLSLFQEQAAQQLAVIHVITGWPATVALLVVSYLYGAWRLQHLEGPSVEEFRAGDEPPWTGQQRGF